MSVCLSASGWGFDVISSLLSARSLCQRRKKCHSVTAPPSRPGWRQERQGMGQGTCRARKQQPVDLKVRCANGCLHTGVSPGARAGGVLPCRAEQEDALSIPDGFLAHHHSPVLAPQLLLSQGFSRVNGTCTV